MNDGSTATTVLTARRTFPVLDEIVYLNTGTMGIMAGPVAERYIPLLRDFECRGVVAMPGAQEWAERARRRLAACLGATPEEIALTGNATDGITYVAAALPWSAGDEVLLSDQEHPALVFPYTFLQQQGRVGLRRFHVSPDPEETVAGFRRALEPGKTRLVAFSHVTSQTGTRLPVRALTAAAHEAGAWCFVDVTQSFGQLAPAEVNLPALGADLAAASGHKWLGAAKGTGFLYVRRGMLAHLTPAHVGAGALRWPAAVGDAPAPGVDARLEPVPAARRFEFGTRNWMLYASVPLALDWLDSLDWAAVVERERSLAGALRRALRDVPGVTQLTPESWAQSSAMTTFAVEGLDCTGLAGELWARDRIRVRTVPELNALRISTAYYNDADDLTRLLTCLTGLALTS